VIATFCLGAIMRVLIPAVYARNWFEWPLVNIDIVPSALYSCHVRIFRKVRLMNGVSTLGGDKRFIFSPQRSDRLWDPISLLLSGC